MAARSPATASRRLSAPRAQTAILTGSTATSYTVTGLANGTAYTFTVAAINANGTGAASSASAPITPSAVPGAPTAVTGTPGNGTVALGWSAPASNGGSPITGYRITPFIGTTAQTAILTGSTATSYTVTGLANGTAYTFTVAAINANGTGAASSASAPITPSAVPGYATTVFTDGFDSGTLSAWNGNAGNGSAVVSTAAAHTGSFGLRLTNTSSTLDVVVKQLAAALTDSSTGLWVRLSATSGLQTVAQARDQTSSHLQWALLYDGTHNSLYFYPYKGSTSTEIYTGNGTAPANTWLHIEIHYTATSTGGSVLYINGQTQPGWSVAGNYTTTTNFQRLQLWNDTTATTDFDDVTIAAP